ncbi:MAG: TIGR03936 family radical SAM-associated protein [Oscillospiraceae bacterium]|jgi:radical SAM-linked protein|nr:TIGR03936 family radical SAM-associated protein [Oscillospiraceae bacterium]
MQDVRIFFEKRARAKYVSHLDLMRCLSRAVRRARVPLWFTEGFHPHAYLNFPRPLPLGQEGLREPLLLRLEQPVPFDALCAGLNKALPEGLRALEAGAAWGDPAEIALADYALYFSFLRTEDAQIWLAQAHLALRNGGLQATRIGKQGRRKVEKAVDVSGMTHAWRLEPAREGVALRCTLACQSERSLNPALLCGALFAAAGEPPVWKIARTALCKADGSPWE